VNVRFKDWLSGWVTVRIGDGMVDFVGGLVAG
jgi:hypothetical protein